MTVFNRIKTDHSRFNADVFEWRPPWWLATTVSPGQTARCVIHERLARKLEGSAKEIVNTSSINETTKYEYEIITHTTPSQYSIINCVPHIHHLYFTYLFTHSYLISMQFNFLRCSNSKPLYVTIQIIVL